MALQNAEKQRNIAIAKKLLAIGDPIDKIVDVTDLTREEVEALRDANKVKVLESEDIVADIQIATENILSLYK